jgi:hypothetical protein
MPPSGKMVMPLGFNIMDIDNGHFGTMVMQSGVKKNEQQYARYGVAFGLSTGDGQGEKVQGGRPRRLQQMCEEHLNWLKGEMNVCWMRMRRSRWFMTNLRM